MRLHGTDSQTERDGGRGGSAAINALQMGVNPLLLHCDYCFLQSLVPLSYSLLPPLKPP